MFGTLRVGFFEDFGGEDTVLFADDGEAMRRLAEVCESLASGGTERVRLESLPFVRSYRGVSILAERSAPSSGLRYADRQANWSRPWSAPPRPAPCFTWRLSAEDWEEVGQRVAASAGGHQHLSGYLGVTDDVQVAVSQGEYKEDWWQRLG